LDPNVIVHRRLAIVAVISLAVLVNEYQLMLRTVEVSHAAVVREAARLVREVRKVLLRMRKAQALKLLPT